MPKPIHAALLGQYGAALAMLSGCLERADATDWLALVDRFGFWHVAYHTLFYADFYLSANEGSFRPQPFHLEDYNFLGPQSWAPDKKVAYDRPYDKETLAGYLNTCLAKVKTAIPAETEASLAAPSGFSWLNFSRLELHIYNIRHIQHHSAQLATVPRRREADGVDWVGSRSPQ